MPKEWRNVMPKFRVMLGICLIALLAFPVLAGALPVPDSTVSVQFVSGGSLIDGVTVLGNHENVYLGPYNLQVPIGDPVSLWMCFDPIPNVYNGETFRAFFTTDEVKAADVWFGGSDAARYDKIHMIAWLANQWDATNPVQMGAINEAIWEISADYNPAVTAPTGNLTLGAGRFAADSPAGNVWLASALSHKGEDWWHSYFVLPGNGVLADHSVQPFVTPDPVPEAGTVFLLASGIVGLCGMLWRGRRS
jgi:hypothetical protein